MRYFLYFSSNLKKSTVLDYIKDWIDCIFSTKTKSTANTIVYTRGRVGPSCTTNFDGDSKSMNIWMEVMDVDFYTSFNSLTLFRNLHKKDLIYIKDDTSQIRYILWSSLKLYSILIPFESQNNRAAFSQAAS